MHKLSHAEILARQVALAREPRVPLVVVLDDIRSLLNVGAIFRAADGVGVEKIFLCGITGYPPQGGIAKTALGAEESVPWEYHKDAIAVVNSLKEKGYTILALEQAREAVSYETFVPGGPVCLVVGNEIEGVSDKLMACCDLAIEIEMRGIKNSLNVAVAFGVAAFSLRRNVLA
ncbi:MAG: RNA methyltransferase [Candidatus Omnitrophica bacterium]|nr:RNA methyltransferase [Candidatus Omnitrophota bacterium]